MSHVTGLHITRSVVRSATLEGRPGRVRVTRTAEQVVSSAKDGVTLEQAIALVLPESPKGSGQIELVLGPTMAIPLVSNMPLRRSSKIRLAVPFEAERLLDQGSPADYTYGHCRMGGDSGSSIIWAAAISRKKLEALVAALEPLGVTPREWLVDSFVTAQLVARGAWSPPPHVWCHCDGCTTTMVLLRVAAPPMVRSFRLRRTASGAIEREAARLLRLAGGLSSDSVPVTVSGPSASTCSQSPEGEAPSRLPLPMGTGDFDPAFLPAVGAALRGHELLDPGPVLYTRAISPLARRLHAIAPGIAAFLLGVSLLALALGVRASRRHEELRAERQSLIDGQADLFTAAFPTRPAGGDLLERARGLLAELKKARDLQAGRRSALEFLDELVSHLPSPSSTALRVRTLHVEGTGALLEAEGRVSAGPAEGIALQVERRLSESDTLEAMAENITVDPLDPTRVSFRVRIKRSEAGNP